MRDEKTAFPYATGRLAAVLFMLIASGLPLAAQQSADFQWIAWQEVPDALRYEVQVRDASGEIVVQSTVTEPWTYVRLQPGDYEFRVTVINRFKKPASTTDWQALVVKKTALPKIDSFEANELVAGTKDNRIRVRGGNFQGETRIYLESGGMGIEGAILPDWSDTSLMAVFSLAGALPGDYVLAVVNPPALRAEASRTLRVKEAPKPVLKPVFSRLSPSSFLSNEGTKEITVYGSAFTEKTEASFRKGEKTIGMTRTGNPSETSLTGTLSLSDTESGSWDLVLLNPGLPPTSVPAVLAILPQPKPVFDSLSPSFGAAGGGTIVDAKLTGKGFEEGMRIELLNGSFSLPLRVKNLTETLALIDIPLDAAQDGFYDLRISNPSGLAAKEPRVLLVSPATPAPIAVAAVENAPPPAAASDAVSETAAGGETTLSPATSDATSIAKAGAASRTASPSPQGRPFGLSLGSLGFIPIGQFGRQIAPTPLAASLDFEVGLGALLLPSVPFVRSLGLGLEANAFSAESRSAAYERADSGMAGLGLFWRPAITKNLSLALRASGGFLFYSLALPSSGSVSDKALYFRARGELAAAVGEAFTVALGGGWLGMMPLNSGLLNAITVSVAFSWKFGSRAP